MINNRQQNGRRRGRGGNGAPRPNGGSGPERGNRIDNRARGNANQLHEKYKTLARDAQMQGDRVTAEYYFQFADHYFRVLSESRSRFEEQRRDRGEPEGFDYDGEGDGEDGGDDRFDEPQYDRRPPQQAQPRRDDREDRGNRDDRNDRNDRGNDGRGNDGRSNEVRGGDGRGNDGRGNEVRGNEPRETRNEPRGERRPRFERDDRERPERAPQPEAPSLQTANDLPEFALEAQAERPAPRRGRPRRQDVAGEEGMRDDAVEQRPRTRRASAPELSAEAEDSRIEVSLLPPALNPAPLLESVEGESDEAPKRRRVRRPRAEGAPADA